MSQLLCTVLEISHIFNSTIEETKGETGKNILSHFQFSDMF